MILQPPPGASMRVHIDLLGLLYLVCGIFGVLIGLSLGVLAAGTSAALVERGRFLTSPPAAVWLFVIVGSVSFGAGVIMTILGRAIRRRARLGRPGALVVAAPSLLVVPIGTALAIYTYWVLLNDEARREFPRRKGA